MELLVFARLTSATSGVLPTSWSWEAFLSAANPAITVALDEQSARRVHGASAHLTMRRVAVCIYGTSADEVLRSDAHSAMDSTVKGYTHRSSTAWLTDEALFADVGGSAAWKMLLETLPPVQCARVADDDGAFSTGQEDRSLPVRGPVTHPSSQREPLADSSLEARMLAEVRSRHPRISASDEDT